MRLQPLAAAFAAVALSTVSCAKEAPPPPAAPVRVESPGLGLAFTALPAGYRVVANAGETLELASGEARVAVTVGPRESAGINLIESARAFQAEIEGAGEKFFGGNELVTPFGSAYTVRGSVDGGRGEERRVLLLHPGDRDRLLTLTQRYAPGDATLARARLTELMELIATLEPLAAVAGGG